MQDDRFLVGTVLNSAGDGIITVTNPVLGRTITLDMSDVHRPRRVSEHGGTEAAGSNQEVWVDFERTGNRPREGDFFRPFRSLAAGIGAVAPGGTLRIVPGSTAERGVLNEGKRLRLSAPIGGVRIGSRPVA